MLTGFADKQAVDRDYGMIMVGLVACLTVLVAVFRYPVPTGMIRISMDLLFESAVVVILSFALYRYVNKWAAAYLLLAFFSMLFPFYGKWSQLAFNCILYGVIWYGALVVILRSRDFEKHLMDAMCIIALFNVGFQMLQVLNADPIFAQRYTIFETNGLMTNPNEVSALLAFCMPAFFRPRWVWLLPVLGLGLILASSTAGILAAGGGAFAYMLLRRRYLLALLIAVLFVPAIAAYFYFIDAPGFERWPVWIHALALLKQHWVFGAGIGHWPWVLQTAGFDVWWTMAHNAFLQGTFEMGIIFPLLVTGYIISLCRRYRAEALLPVTAAVIITLNIAVNFAMHVAVTRMLVITWLAILEVKLRRTEVRSRMSEVGSRKAGLEGETDQPFSLQSST